MHTLSDAILLRDAIMAERRAERAKAASNTIVFVAPTVTPAATPTSAPVKGGFLSRLRAIACL